MSCGIRGLADCLREVTHPYESSYKSDDNKHWYECTVCGAVRTVTEQNDFDNDCKCDTCGTYISADTTDNSGTTDPEITTDDGDTESKNGKGTDLAWLWIVIAVVVVGGIVLFIIFAKKKDKK